jgi:uncharacterized protein
MGRTRDFRGLTALVTGASSGIGRAFAEVLAERGARLVLVARGRDRLEALAADLRRARNSQVLVVPRDLSTPGAGEAVAAEVERAGWGVDLLVNNAGVGQYGPFEALAVAGARQAIQLNVLAPVELTHALLPQLRARRGGVIFVSSLQGLLPFSYMSTYAATKAFEISFAESLSGELRRVGVDVLAVLPGITKTEFFRANEIGREFPFPVRQPRQVVQTALDNLGRRTTVIDGAPNRLVAWLLGKLPRRWAIAMNARVMAPPPETKQLAPPAVAS